VAVLDLLPASTFGTGDSRRKWSGSDRTWKETRSLPKGWSLLVLVINIDY
jgi:hypothetical protein